MARRPQKVPEAPNPHEDACVSSWGLGAGSTEASKVMVGGGSESFILPGKHFGNVNG